VRTKRSREGELLIDHRASPGLTAEQVGAFAPAVPKGEVYESAVSVCAHCQAAVILEPKRTRAREWCAKCDRYICDDCAAVMARTLVCRSAARRIDEIQNHVEHLGNMALLLGR
jgi:hypothetical protein